MNLPSVDKTHSADLASWVPSALGHADFPIQNLPFGVFAPAGGRPRIGTAIGDCVLDLCAVGALLPPEVLPLLELPELNALMAAPRVVKTALRHRLSELLSDDAHRPMVEPALHDAACVEMLLPMRIGDYTDFYVGIHHATNIGKLFRPDNPLLPNYKHVPIGYHGRASSIRQSGVPVARPRGQRRANDADVPVFGPCTRLDYELELGVWIGEGNALGTTIPIAEAGEHIAGLCLLNDWSARDIQAWEYQPLGPFLAKNFHTTISPWVVTAEALAPFRIAQPPRPLGDPDPLPYLRDEADRMAGAFAIELSVWLTSEQMRAGRYPPLRLSRGPASNMYWTIAQMVTHHASNGCGLNSGDLLGTGTISGTEQGSKGSLIEISEGGRVPVELPTGETRTFLLDGDEISFSATATAPGRAPIGFGECRAVIRPAP